MPAGFELLSNASVYSRHIGPSYARKEADGASLVQPTLPHMCNSGGVLHGGYMMSFADSAVTRAAGLTTGMAPSTVAFAAEFLSAGTRHDADRHPGRGAAPRQVARLRARPARAGRPQAPVLFGDHKAAAARRS